MDNCWIKIKIMITNITEHFVEILAEEGFELYNSELDITTNRITAPLNTDLSKWIERKTNNLINKINNE